MAKSYTQLQRELDELEATMTDEQLDAVETNHMRKSRPDFREDDHLGATSA